MRQIRYIGLAFILLLTSQILRAQDRFTYEAPKMGSPFQIILYADDSVYAKAVSQNAFSLVDSLNQIFSDYLPNSEINRLTRFAGKDTAIGVSTPLYELLKIAMHAYQKTGGIIDIGMGTLTKAWRQARAEKQFLTKAQVRRLLERAGAQHIVLHQAKQAVTIQKKGLSLDFGALAKGYIAQEVADYITRSGIQSCLVSAGGDIVVTDAPPNATGWKIAVEAVEEGNILKDIIILKNAAVVTSGDMYQFSMHRGKRYSHIIHPKTGYGSTKRRTVTVIANRGAQADWLATAASLMPLKQLESLIHDERACAHIIYQAKRQWKRKTIGCTKSAYTSSQ